MKRSFFFTMLAAMLFAVTGVMAQEKANFKPANLQGIWQLCHYVSELPDVPGTLRPSNTFKVLSADGAFRLALTTSNRTVEGGTDSDLLVRIQSCMLSL